MTTETSSLRRSTRRVKKRTYNVGDIVVITEMEHHADRVPCPKGRLLSKLTDNRWLVGFEDHSWPEEDMSESSFGEILGKSPPSPSDQSMIIKTRRNKKTSSGVVPQQTTTDVVALNTAGISTPESHKNATTSTVTSSSSTEDRRKKSPSPQLSQQKQPMNNNNNENKKKRPATEFVFPAVAATASAGEDSSLPSIDAEKRSDSATAREQRSRRRQALLEEDHVIRSLSMPAPAVRPSKKKKTSHHPGGSHNNTNKSNVIRVPMKMGTLIIYRGEHRRAEFDWKV